MRLLVAAGLLFASSAPSFALTCAPPEIVPPIAGGICDPTSKCYGNPICYLVEEIGSGATIRPWVWPTNGPLGPYPVPGGDPVYFNPVVDFLNALPHPQPLPF